MSVGDIRYRAAVLLLEDYGTTGVCQDPRASHEAILLACDLVELRQTNQQVCRCQRRSVIAHPLTVSPLICSDSSPLVHFTTGRGSFGEGIRSTAYDSFHRARCEEEIRQRTSACAWPSSLTNTCSVEHWSCAFRPAICRAAQSRMEFWVPSDSSQFRYHHGRRFVSELGCFLVGATLGARLHGE